MLDRRPQALSLGANRSSQARAGENPLLACLIKNRLAYLEPQNHLRWNC